MFINKSKLTIRVTITVLLLLLISFTDVEAQCAMCRAVAESNLKNEGATVGKGLNTGILYLMVIPYLLLAAIAGFFFKKQILAKLKQFTKARI